MPTPRWELFGGAVVIATLALIALSRATARAIAAGGEPGDFDDLDGPGGLDDLDGPGNFDDLDGPAEPAPDDGEALPPPNPVRPAPPLPSGGALLANVAFTHGLLGVTVVVLAWYAQLPPSALGLGSVTASSVGAGLAVGVGLYAASETATAVADRIGIEYDERLRDLLAPDGPAEWALMFLVILPIVAGAEELLFRGALIGALAAGFGLPLPALVIASSVLFGAGHSAQGALGVVATAAMGLVLGTAFVLTGSLLAVVLAHYVVNALEFVVREGVFD